MRIKKKTSIMMATATTLAAVGIAAVSFAAWTGNNQNVTADAATGSANLYGFADSTLDFGADAKLVPFDQEPSSVTAGTKTISKALPAITVDARDFNLTFNNLQVTTTGDNAATTADFTVYVQVTTSETAPALTKTGETTLSTDWKSINDGYTYNYSSTGTAEATEVDVNEDGSIATLYVHLALVSDNTAAMNQTFEFDIVLAPVEA